MKMKPSYPGRIIGDYNIHAAGDFTIIDKKTFVKLRGYPEQETYGGWDSVLLMIGGVELNMCQVTLLSPYTICHQHHERMEVKKLPPTLYGKIWNNVMAGKSPQTNDEKWGLIDDITLQEQYFDGRNWKTRNSIVIKK